MFSVLLDATADAGASSIMMIVWLVVFFVIMYFLMIRPQKKDMMLSEIAVGDTVLTTSGFYGTIIDITDDTVIVEFGNNKNCRIPMTKSAISAVEKPEDATKEEPEKKGPNAFSRIFGKAKKVILDIVSEKGEDER